MVRGRALRGGRAAGEHERDLAHAWRFSVPRTTLVRRPAIIGPIPIWPARFARHEHVRQRGAVGLYLFCHRREVKVAEPARNEPADCAGGLHEVPDFGVPVRPHCHDRDDADLHQRVVHVDELRDVRELQHHAVERLEPRLGEADREVVDPRPELAIGEALGAGHERFAIPPACDRLVELLADR
jgi:hypothetical protein